MLPKVTAITMAIPNVSLFRDDGWKYVESPNKLCILLTIKHSLWENRRLWQYIRLWGRWIYQLYINIHVQSICCIQHGFMSNQGALTQRKADLSKAVRFPAWSKATIRKRAVRWISMSGGWGSSVITAHHLLHLHLSKSLSCGVERLLRNTLPFEYYSQAN